MRTEPIISRRKALIAGLASIGGLLLPGCSKKLPPTYGNILRMGDVFTYTAHRALIPEKSLAREYSRKDISSFPATGTTNPGGKAASKSGAAYRQLQDGAFADWQVSIEGLVARSGSYSIADLKRFPFRTQITRHTCEEGWSAIAEWTGVALGRVLEHAGMLPHARFVNFVTFDGWNDGIDMFDALHPQTLLAYGMNGRDLPIAHGAPVRLRVETQMGYRSLKYLQRIIVTENLDHLEKLGHFKSPWSWYAGI